MRTAEIAELTDKISEKNEELTTAQKRIENFDLGEKELEAVQDLLENNPKYVLPEPTTLMSAKSYKQKIVEPLLTKMRDLVQKFVQKYFLLKDRFEYLQSNIRSLNRDNAQLKESNNDLALENDSLWEENKDYRLLRKIFGDSEIDVMLDQTRSIQALKQCEKRVRNKDYER